MTTNPIGSSYDDMVRVCYQTPKEQYDFLFENGIYKTTAPCPKKHCNNTMELIENNYLNEYPDPWRFCCFKCGTKRSIRYMFRTFISFST